MKPITKLLVSIYTLIYYSSFAQSPSFNTNLNISNSFVCFDGQLTVSATASNADFYQFQRRNETTNLWENIIGASGTPSPTTGSLSHTFFNIREATTTRVYLAKNAEIVYSNDLTITPQRPTFNFQPIDITECNGLNAVFRASASGINAITYQWQENIGGVFQNATNTTDFSGMTSANLTVKNLANNENGRIFRCLVKDQNNCENYSSSATLFVNQLSTVISPTVSTTFCEGDTAHFFVALKVGAVSSYEWQLKKTLDIGYSNISESNHFEGVNTEKLSVNGIFPNETSYRLNVNFVSLSQNADGTRASNTCLKTATRANYIIRPRPNPPTQIPDIFRCGEGKFTTTAAGIGSFYWYSDTTTTPLISNNTNFVSPIISVSKQYYLSLKDINQCESYKRTFTAIVRPLPKQEYTKTYSICPSEIFFTLNFNSKNNNPLQLNVINHAPALPNFTPVLNGTFSDSFNVPLPNNPQSGNYKFKVFSKNEHCYSDTSIIDLEIKQATSINVSPSNSTICEGLNQTFNIQYSAEAPVYFRWFKDDIVIPNETTSTLTLNNITLQTQGNYTAEVSGKCGTKTSEKALLTVLPKVKITEQPKETIVCQNGNAKIKLVATGTGILNYKWTLNGVGIGSNSTELTLENVPISYNNAKIKCEISSDCGQSVFSNEILLLVDDLPPAPTIPSSIGFCKSNTPGILSALATPKHKLTWYDESQIPLVSNQLDVSSIFTKIYYVSQKDTNLCEGPKSSFQVVVSEPFSINLLADKAGVCSSGLFNRTGFINTVVYSTNSDLSSFSFDLLKNNLLKSNNNTGEFEISEGGIYKVIGKSNYCSDTSEIEIISILPELAVPPTVLPKFEVCENSNLTIEATGSYSNGNFHWYSNATTQFSDFSGSSRTLINIISDQSHYVAYGITSNDIYCESPRVLSSITLKPDLIIDAVVQNASCLGINDGKIKSSINNGQSPYTFTLNNINNSTGIFENLSIGNYQLTASDAKGCKGEITVSIGVLPGPNIAQQPVSISRCKSNIANFMIVASNYDQIIWEKKLPNTTSFEIIIGENQANLRLENIGNATNPHLTIYRAKVIKGACFIYSEVATLFVNAITGTGLPKSVCEGNKSTIDLNDYNIEGSNKIYQWQYRPGTTGTFVDVNGKTSEILEILSTTISNIGFYRCKITFDNGGGNTCIINTSTTGIKLNVDTPQIPLLTGNKTICKGQTTTLSGTNCTGILTWSDASIGLNVNISPNTTTTYTANCKNGACDSPSGNSVKIIVEDNPVNAPKIILARTKYCVGEKINLTAENCMGIVVWSNGLQGNSIEINAVSSFNISAHCKTQNCQSPESPVIAVTVYPVLTAGSIVSNSTRNCSGFNPLTINSITNPNGGNIQWQKSESCSSQNPIWVNIDGETGLTYNPPALLTSTCFRRMVSDTCQTLFSNTTTFEIVPDPILEILSDKNQVCFGQKVNFSKNLVGGEGVCGIQWQINKVSSAVSSAFWTNITVADVLEFKNTNAGNDSTFHFRARVDCSNSSCNLATSNVVSVVFHPELVINTAFSDSTICSGSTIILASSGCKANILWSTGETSAQISVSPILNTVYKVSCKNSCDQVSKNVLINVTSGISSPSITVAKTKYCFGENIQISASNCAGEIVWSNGFSGSLINISASNSFNISAHCKTQNCQSPESPVIAVSVYPVLTAGSIVSNSTINCSGFNPLTINSIINPSGGSFQWQKSENCSSQNPTWVNIDGETGLTYNPPALLTSTCFRRMVSDYCQTLFSNITTFDIVPDPILEILSDKNQVCFGQKVIFSKNLIGGEGVCGIQWQINKVSSAISSAFWTNITLADALEFKNTNAGNDSTFHFRARVDCSNSSCNLATSNVVSVVFHPELDINTAFSDSTICSGSTIILASSGCKVNILWSTGETSAQISVSPILNTVYKVACKNSCDEVSKSVKINVIPGISSPLITIAKTKYCFGENIQISASNCTGKIVWSNGFSGSLINISASNSFNISAHCISQNCQSPESPVIAVTVYPVLAAGSIVSNSTINCSGFNPLTINSIINPSGGNIQWQKSENCSSQNPTWVNINGETGLTFNPPALLTSTCFRRMVSDTCQTLFSNTTTFEIVPDPILEILADKNQVCFGQKVILTKNLVGGEGVCGIQWQINKVSSAVSSAFWTNITVADVLEFKNTNTGNDSTFHFRARVDCSNSSCNLATSNAVSVVFHPELVMNTTFSDSTICSGSMIILASSGCKANILWSTGETSAQISVSPNATTTYSVACKNSCDEVSKSVKIYVIPGISSPLITIAKTKYCFGENIQISASNCTGKIVWSNGFSGSLINISASNSFNISAHCISQNCQSPESPVIAVTVYPVLAAGSIVSNSTINCSGFNPLTINSITNPNDGNIQWQKSESCSSQNPIWVNIDGETGLTYNPPALLTSTCFRRMVSETCQTLVSNTTTFEIVPDPILEILADKNQVCFGQKVILTKNLVGGEGVCGIQWQINKVSSAVSSAFWTNITVADALEFKNTNAGNDSTFHFRARVDCSNSSCNLATSNVVSVVFHPELDINTAFSDSTICSGSTIILASSGCKVNILWSTGETSAQISVSPIVNMAYKVSCKNSCDEVSKSFNIGVVEGIGKPVNTTPKSFLSPQILKFTAEGQNLKWYNSINSVIPLSLAPEITITGNYTFWVTQTIGICESPRLEIQSELFPALQIISQPGKITNCFGNTSNIDINASGSGTLKYKWQRKRPNEISFSDITTNQSSLENFDSKELKIKSIGNSESPYLTIFRCIINDDFSEKQSEEIEIIVNRLDGNLANQKLCLGNNLDLNLNNSHKITGSPKLIQWQQRQGTGTDWINLKDSANYSGSNSLHFSINNLTLENQQQYRCSVVFNSTTGTCTETTDLMSLNVGSFPQTPENKGFEFCQNASSPELELYEPNNFDIIWYLPGSQIGMTKQPIIDTKTAGNQIYFYSLKNTADCESPKATVQIIIHPEPSKPISITPIQVIEGESLVFNALGENLKWYTSRTGKTFTGTSPIYQKIGRYDLYVSQTSPKGCESDRTYIESEIITAFGINTQPISQANCEGNTTTFSIKTKGSLAVSYKWQILKNGIFQDIAGENSSSLKIEDVGKAPYLDGTIFRAVVSNSTQEIISNEITLKVNKIEGKLTDIDICEDMQITSSILKENIVGNFNQIEWQKKEGDTYVTKFISKKIEDNFLAIPDNSGNYRLRVTFQNQGSSTCVRTSNSLKIDVNKKPEPIQKLNYSVCQYTSMKTILKEFPSNYVLRNLDSSIVNITYFNESKPMVFLGNYTNEKGCTSNYQKINFDILPAPILQMVDSTLNYCQFSNELKSLKINDLNTFWYASETDEEATENVFQINTSENQTHFRWYALESNNGCLSQKNKIKIDLDPCFFKEKKDTCFNQSGKALMPNEWNYFYNANGKIYAAIHPNGQNLGTVRIDFRNTKNSFLKDKNETQLYPRYFNVQTSRKSTSKFKLRFYMTLEEITAITSKDPEDVSIINYAGQNLDCDLLNNKIEDNYWLETNETWQEDNQQNIFFAEFSTQKTGEFGLWDTSIPKGILSGEVNSTNIPVLTISDKSSGGNYKIMKSKDGKTWFEWLEKITQSEFFDLKPFVLDNYYQLLFDYGNGIKTLRNTINLTLADEVVACAILENPSENRDFFKLYFPNIDKTTIQLSTALGQTLDLMKTSEVRDYMEIYPKSQLPHGMYILKAQNSSGKNCFAKVWLK